MIHIDEEPPDEAQPVGMLRTVIAKETDYESIAWLQDRNIEEAWIYNLDRKLRVMAWYE